MIETQPDAQPAGLSVLAAVSNAMVALHKEQFGRGPTRARTDFAGPDGIVCVLDKVLLPAELRLVELGQHERVRDARGSYQAATAPDFIAAVEAIVQRKVRAFASAVDPDNDVVFEHFQFESRNGNGDAGGSNGH